MTCIVALVERRDDESKRVWIGGDSAGVAGWDLTSRADGKVFHRGPFVMGFTSSFRMGQLLRYALDVPDHPAKLDTSEYMVTRFVDAVRKCLKTGGFASKEDEVETGGTFIVGYRGKIFVVGGDYQVGEPADPFAAVGCGDQVARGALWTLYETRPQMAPEQMVRTALLAAERHSAGVRSPFTIAVEPEVEET